MKAIKIITGASALYLLGFIDYNPKSLTIAMEYGTKVDAYDNLNISTQKLNTLMIGVQKYNEQYHIYKPERLFVEYDMYPLENTIDRKGLEKLEEVVNPQVVKDIYHKLIKAGRRRINKERIEKYLSKHFIKIDEALNQPNVDKVIVLREYIICLMGKELIPVSLVKGGSAVELYVDFKRATEDIDTHLDKSSIDQVLEILQNKQNTVYFKINNIEEFNSQREKGNQILELELTPVSRKGSINDLFTINGDRKISLKLNINLRYSKEQLLSVVKEFNISKTKLSHFENGYGLFLNEDVIQALSKTNFIK